MATSTFSNEAAWITAARARSLKVGPGPQPDPTEDEVVIKVAYAAVNPVDYKVPISRPISGWQTCDTVR